MAEKAASTRGFRPRGLTAERVVLAENLGVVIGEVVNKMFEEHPEYLETAINQRKKELRKVLEAPIPS